MKPSSRMSATASGGAAVISNDPNVTFLFVGASCQASLQPMTPNVDSLSLSVEKGKNAVVSIRARYSYATRGTAHLEFNQFLVGLSWKDDKLVVDLEKNFISPLGRLANMDESGNLQTLANGQRFVALHPESKKEDWTIKGYRIIDDPNLICKYLIGDANEADLEFAATEDNRSQTERELGKARQQLAEQADVLERNRQTVKAAIADVEEARATIQRLTEEKKALEKKNDEDKADFVSFVVKISRIIQASRFGNRGLTLSLIGTRVSDFLRENPNKKN